MYTSYANKAFGYTKVPGTFKRGDIKDRYTEPILGFGFRVVIVSWRPLLLFLNSKPGTLIAQGRGHWSSTSLHSLPEIGRTQQLLGCGRVRGPKTQRQSRV